MNDQTTRPESSQLQWSGHDWTVIIPFFNEEAYLPATLQSLADQTLTGFRLILVDNASNDRSHAVATEFVACHPKMNIEVHCEPEPGQIPALRLGFALTDSEFIATCDADTLYPPHYLETATRLYTKGGTKTVAALGFGVTAASGFNQTLVRIKGVIAAGLMRRQCHTGVYGQTFRTAILKKAGGYDRTIWPYCLQDHELINRIVRYGRLAYDYNLWCQTSDRRTDRGSVNWTLGERVLYHLTPHSLKDWFFYQFLKPRFAARNLSELNLRERNWE